jgi:uncharacterized repeat protein (TIGR02543 family)
MVIIMEKIIMKSSSKKILTLLFTVSILLCMLQTTVYAANEPSKIQVDVNNTLENAVEQANSMESAIIEIKDNVAVTSPIIITSNITIIGSDGMHTISNCHIQVKDGASLTLGDGTTTNTFTILGSIHIIDGSIHVKDGAIISTTGAGSIAINVDKGNVVVSGGKVLVTGSYSSAIEVTEGNVLVSGGEVIADGDGLHGCYAIYLYNPGTVTVTGGVVSAHNAIANMFAITLDGGGLAAYLKDTCEGDFLVSGSGIIVEAESFDISSSYAGTANGLTRKAGSALSFVKCDLSGVIPVISFNNGQYIIEWTTPEPAPPVNPTETPVKIQETNELFETLAEAIAKASSEGLNTFTLEIIGDVAETSDVIIKSSITIVGAEGAHTISNCYIKVKDGGSLTLGDGTITDLLTISGNVVVTDGEINIQDGVKITSGGTALNLSGPNVTGTISGGIFTGNIALNMEKGAKLSAISGGTFTGRQDALHMTDDGTRIDVISGGVFYQTDTTVTLHGHAVFVQNEAKIGKISGGYFEAVKNCALVVIRGAWINEISGGNFVAIRKGSDYYADDPDPRNAVIHVESEKNAKTGIGTISGGLFHGGAHFGILVINYYSSTTGARIDLISGGDIQGTVALQVDVGCDIGEISGGTINGTQGMLNAGTIDKISGNVEINGTTSYGIYNFAGGKINEISGGKIVSSSSHGIANAGTINLISGGTIIGGQYAIYCVLPMSGGQVGVNGVLGTISGGVFWGKTDYAFRLLSDLQLEPGLSANRGFGRYQSGNGLIFNNEGLVKYPDGYHMSTLTVPVSGIESVKFRFLTLDDKYAINYELNGGVNAVGNPDSYDETDLPCSITDPTMVGYTFKGWVITFANGTVIDTVFDYSIPVGSTGDVTFTAQWTDTTYVVHYYLMGTSLSVAPDKFGTGSLGQVVTETALSIAGYTAIAPDVKSLLLVESGNELFFYYVVTNPPIIYHTLTYYCDTLTSGSVPVGGVYPHGVIVTVAGQGDMVRDGYVFLGWDTNSTATSVVYGAGDSLTMLADVDLFAVWQPVVDLSTLYTVHYYLQGTTQSVAVDKVGSGMVGSTVTESAITISGYAAVAPTSLTGVLNATGNVFVFYYTPNVEYVVHYYLQGTTTPVAVDKVVGGQTLGAVITENAITITGYAAVAPTVLTGTLNATGNVFVFYYTPNVEYTVHYYLQGTTTSVAVDKVVGGQTLGAVITENAITVTGYTAVAPTSLTGTLNATGNVFVFYYTANSNGGGDGGNGGGSGGGNSGGGGSGRPSPSPSVTPPPSVVTPTSPPEVVEAVLTWALLNLILSIIGVILAIVLVIFALLWRNKKQKEEQEQQTKQGKAKGQQYTTTTKYGANNETEQQKQQKRKQRRTLLLLASVVLGIVGIVVFFLTEDMSRVMAWVDKWTIVNAIILIVEIIAAIFTFKTKKEEKENNDDDKEAVQASQKMTQTTP